MSPGRLVALMAAGLLAGCSADPGSRPAPVAPSTSKAGPSVTSAGPVSTAPAAALLQLELRGLGPVRVGMTVAEASAALRQSLEPIVTPDEACTLYAPAVGFDGVAFLVSGGVVARIDVVGGTTATATGVTIGQSEAEAQRRYANRLVVTPHDFHIGGHYLTFVPPEAADAGFRLVAETDGRKVTSMRAGRLPEVELTEGCA